MTTIKKEKSKIRVKIFEETSTYNSSFENQINIWINDHPQYKILSIKQSICQHSDRIVTRFITVTYKK